MSTWTILRSAARGDSSRSPTIQLIVSEERAKVDGNLVEDIKNVKRSGTADLLLHGDRVPPWLAKRMTDLGTAIAEHVSLEYGASEFLTCLSDPFWFRA